MRRLKTLGWDRYQKKLEQVSSSTNLNLKEMKGEDSELRGDVIIGLRKLGERHVDGDSYQRKGEWRCFVGVKKIFSFFSFFLVFFFLYAIVFSFFSVHVSHSHSLVSRFYGRFCLVCFIHTPELGWRVGYIFCAYIQSYTYIRDWRVLK